jgi:hypothetical protein
VFETAASNGAVGNVDWLRLSPAAAQTPYAAHAPGQPIQAEHFDLGGFGVAYFDDTPATVSKLRPTEAVEITTTPGPAGETYVTLRPGEWAEYTATVAQAGNYELLVRARAVTRNGWPRISLAGRDLYTYSTRTDFTETSAGLLSLAAGTHTIRLTVDSGVSDIDYLVLVRRD